MAGTATKARASVLALTAKGVSLYLEKNEAPGSTAALMPTILKAAAATDGMRSKSAIVKAVATGTGSRAIAMAATTATMPAKMTAMAMGTSCLITVTGASGING